MADQKLQQNFRRRIVRQYMVRFHMSLLLAATLAAGLLTSKLLLAAGLHSVLWRYPLAVLGGYVVFAGLARIWVAYVLIDAVATGAHSFFTRARSSGSSSGVDLDLGGSSSFGSSPAESGVSFGGGDSGGGGASDVWEAGSTDAVSPPAAGSGGGGSGFHFPSLDLDIDLDDGFWILIALAVVALVLACVGGYLIWAAPEILPDLALNALLTSTLTGAAKRAQTRGWMVSVLRATFIPLLLILGVTIGLAVTVHHHCPGAQKLTTALACPDELRPPAVAQPAE